MVLYEGIFFDDETTQLLRKLEEKPLEIKSDYLHCTFKFLPKNYEVFNNLANKQFDIYLIGYGNDGDNSGFEVSLSEELKKYYINYEKDNPSILKKPI